MAKVEMLKGTNKDRTHKYIYVMPILECLNRNGGLSSPQEVYAYILEVVALNNYDWQPCESSNGEFYWQNQVRWTACRMRENGLLEPSVVHGLWEISEKGKSILF